MFFQPRCAKFVNHLLLATEVGGKILNVALARDSEALLRS